MKSLDSLSTLIKNTKNYVSDNWLMLIKIYLYSTLLYIGAGLGLGVLVLLIALASQALNLEFNWFTGSLLGVISLSVLLFLFSLGGRVLLLQLKAIRQPIAGIRKTFKAISFKDGLSIYWLVVIVALAFYSGLLLLIVPGVIVATWLSLVLFTWEPGESNVTAMIKSRAYVLGYFWPVFSRSLFAITIYLIGWSLSMQSYNELANINGFLGTIGYILYTVVFAILTMSIYRFSYELYLNLTRIKGQLKPALTTSRVLRYKLLAYGPISLLGIVILIAIAMNPLENLQKASETIFTQTQLEELSKTK